MIRTSVLDLLFVPERHRRQAAKVQSGGGFALPVLQEQAVGHEEGPFVVSNMRQSFLLGRRSQEGNVRVGFSDCTVGEEGPYVTQLVLSLERLSVENGWSNRCTSLAEARPMMKALKMEPSALLVPHTLLAEAAGTNLSVEDAGKLMTTQGHIVQIDGVRILVWPGLPDHTAMLVAPPAMAGTYIRVDHYLGILATRADRAFVIVREVRGGVA